MFSKYSLSESPVVYGRKSHSNKEILGNNVTTYKNQSPLKHPSPFNTRVLTLPIGSISLTFLALSPSLLISGYGKHLTTLTKIKYK